MEFTQRIECLSEKEKGDVFECLAKAFLQLDPEYATKLRKVWLQDEVPTALRKKLPLHADDQGIDLIAETNTGEFWAIQCKYREDSARPLPWRKILTFIVSRSACVGTFPSASSARPPRGSPASSRHKTASASARWMSGRVWMPSFSRAYANSSATNTPSSFR